MDREGKVDGAAKYVWSRACVHLGSGQTVDRPTELL